MAVTGGGLCILVLVASVAGCAAHDPRFGDRERDAAVHSPDAQALDAGRGRRSAVSPIEPFLELAGDGSSAYRKIADVWCTRILRCDEIADHAASVADHAGCVEEVVRQFSTSDTNKNETEIGCDGSGDITIDPSRLAKCLRAFSDAGCGRVYRQYWWSLYNVWYDRLLADCADAAEEALAKEETQRGVLQVDSTCRQAGNPCGFQALCIGPSGTDCGVCRARPVARQACLMIGPDGSGYCGIGYTCKSGVCTGASGGQGEPCDEGKCNSGLDCDENDRCAELHRVDDVCDGNSCGEHMHCVDGRCREYASSTRGSRCDVSGHCGSGYCRDGQCAELPRLGELCAEICSGCALKCLPPFACSEGRCVESPRCGQGKNEPCYATWQCAPGYLCTSTLPDQESRCMERKPKLGEGCQHGVECSAGTCVNGRCALSEGSLCGDGWECASYACLDGRCADIRCGS